MTGIVRALFVLILVLAPGLAFAHSPIKGFNNFYNGLLHPLLVPAHLLLLLATGLFIGQHEPKQNQTAWIVFLVAATLGLVPAGFTVIGQMETVVMAIAAVIGLLIAASPRISLNWCALITAVAGFVIGLDSTQETLNGKAKLVAIFGSGVGIYFFSLYPVAFADYFSAKPWQKIGIRVLGSWLAASSLLVLALSLAPLKR